MSLDVNVGIAHGRRIRCRCECTQDAVASNKDGTTPAAVAQWHGQRDQAAILLTESPRLTMLARIGIIARVGTGPRRVPVPIDEAASVGGLVISG
jgi:hypothetical protein